MAVYLAVLGYEGVVDEVFVHSSIAAAMKRVEEHLHPSGLTAQRWFDLLEETNEYPDDEYEPTNVYVCELED